MNGKHIFQPSEANGEFKNYILEGLNTILIGVPQIDNGNIDDISLILSGCKGDVFCNKRAERITCLDNIYSRLLCMPLERRQAVEQFIDRLKASGTIRPHIGRNFWAVLNVLAAYYQSSLSQIIFSDPLIESIFVDDFLYSINEEEAKNRAFDDIGKLRNTAKPRKENQQKINQFCASFLISPSVLFDGEGQFYTVRIPENITNEEATNFYNRVMENIAESVQKDDLGRNLDLKHLLLQEGIVSEDYIEEWTLKTYFTFWYVPRKEVAKINEMLNATE